MEGFRFSGSNYYNYKHTIYSIVLLDVTGPNYKCFSADVESIRRMNDSGIWNKSRLHCVIGSRKIGIPGTKILFLLDWETSLRDSWRWPFSLTLRLRRTSFGVLKMSKSHYDQPNFRKITSFAFWKEN